MRLPRRLQVLFALAATLAGCSSQPTVPASTATLDRIEQAAVHAGSVHLVDTATASGSTSVLTGTISTKASALTITTSPGGALARVVALPGRLFVAGNAAGLTDGLGFPASVYAKVGGGWVELTPKDAPYATLHHLVSFAGVLLPYLASSPLKVTQVHPPGGQQSVVVTGPWAPQGNLGGWRGLATLAALGVPPLPTYGLLQLHHGATTASRSAQFTKWGVPFSVLAPPATSYATATGS